MEPVEFIAVKEEDSLQIDDFRIDNCLPFDPFEAEEKKQELTDALKYCVDVLKDAQIISDLQSSNGTISRRSQLMGEEIRRRIMDMLYFMKFTEDEEVVDCTDVSVSHSLDNSSDLNGKESRNDSTKSVEKMPWKYKRKTNKNSWTETQLRQAIRSITHGPKLKIRDASRKYGIPESTIRKRMKSNSFEHGPLGRKPTFTIEEETQLEKHIINLAKQYNGITVLEIRRVVYEFAEANKISHNFNTALKLVGRDWVYLFLKRHPRISLRPEDTSLDKITTFNKDSVTRFLNNLSEVFETFKFRPNQIYNMDETDITTVQNKCPIVFTQKGAKKVEAATSEEKGQTITAVFCVNAAGRYVPPMLIYPRVDMTPQLQRNGPSGAIYACSKNGGINEHLYMNWLQHFKNHVKPTQDNPMLLILDNHTSHISLAAVEFCKANFITIVTLPTHTSPKTQPLHLTFINPLKNALYQEYEYNLAGLLNKAFLKVATMENGISGFFSAGIWPLNPDKFKEDELDQTMLKEFISETLFEIFKADENVDFDEKDDSADRETASPAPNDSISDPLDSIPCASTSTFPVADIAPVSSRNSKIQHSHQTILSELLTASSRKKKLEQTKKKKIRASMKKSRN